MLLNKKKKTEPKTQLTPFEWKVLKTAMTIPFGETRSYQWIAKRVGSPKAVRAVGQALRKNPYPVIIPCHRVVMSNGALGGYAGRVGSERNGSVKKERLLKKEQEVVMALRGFEY